MAVSKKTAAATETKAAVKVEEAKTQAKAVTPAAPAKTEKEESAKKAPAKKAAAKTVETAAGKETVKKEKVKKASAKKVEVKSEIYVQFGGKEYSQDDILEIAKNVWKYDLEGKEEDLKSIDLYVKPEESMVYYVINSDISGSFSI